VPWPLRVPWIEDKYCAMLVAFEQIPVRLARRAFPARDPAVIDAVRETGPLLTRAESREMRGLSMREQTAQKRSTAGGQ